ncbi:MAG: protein kinase, partial [Myxococcota bacterium]
PHLPLGDLLAASGGRLSFAAAARVGADVASALAHAHGKARLVHGSLTPSSLVVGPDGLIAVADFGRPREADAGPHRDPGYLPPERLMGAPPSPRGDLYALAVTLHELLSGRRLFPVRPSLPETLDEILRIVPPELEGAPPDLAEIVGAALAKEPEARPADLEQVADRLAAVAGAAGRRELASTAGEILGVTPPPAPFVATPALAVSRSLEPRPLERRRSSERLLWVALAVGGWSTALALGFGRGGRAARPAAVAAPASPKSQPAVTLPAPAAAPVPPAGASTASFSEASSSSSAEISAPASATPAAVAPEAGAPSDAVAPAPRSPQRPEPRPRRRSSTRAVKWDRDAVFRAIDRLREREPDLASDFFVRLSEMDPKDERALHALGREVRAALAR